MFDFFGGGQEDDEQLPQTPIYRSIDPNGRYRSVCVRLCDGFFYPVPYSTYGSLLGQDAQSCQANCAAPAELYVYRNPGQEIEQAVSLSGSAYMDLPVALRFRKEYVTGCSCKQAEYNPTEIEAARLLVYKAAYLKDEGRNFTLTAAQAKLKTGRLAVRCAEEAVQIHGGYGYIEEYPVCRFYRDAKILTIGEGTDEVQQMVIARALGA